MANYTSSADLIDDVLFRIGEPTDGTSSLDSAALRYLNRAYQGIWAGGSELDPTIQEVWWWLRKDDQGTLILNPVIDTGTVSVTNNSASVTFSSAPTPSVAGRHFKVNDHADVFIITAHTAGQTGATLESVYTGDTNASASYRVMHLDYDLNDTNTDILYLSSPMFAYQADRGEIQHISLHQMREKWALNQVASGVPRNFSMLSETAVRFSHYGGRSSTELIKIDYEYVREPSDLVDNTTAPLVPRQYRKVLSDWATGLLYETKGDSRAQGALLLARNGLRSMSNENRKRLKAMGRGFGHIFTRQGQLDRFIGPLRTETGLIIGA